MLEALDRLIELQELDTELRNFEGEASRLPEARIRGDATRTAAEERVATAREGLQTAEGDQRRAEGELRDQEAVLQKLEGQQHQVKSNVAFTALLQEMEQAREGISGCETRILEAMEAIESAKEALAVAEREAAETLARLDGELREIDEREKELGVEISRVREARAGVIPHIDDKILTMYEKVAVKRWPAAVLVTNERCAGCRIDIPPQSYIEVLRGERLVTCGQCNRILLPGEKLGASEA